MNHTMRLSSCPRCQSKAYEILATHAYCIECNYSPEEREATRPLIPSWAKASEKKQSEDSSPISIIVLKSA